MLLRFIVCVCWQCRQNCETATDDFGYGLARLFGNLTVQLGLSHGFAFFRIKTKRPPRNWSGRTKSDNRPTMGQIKNLRADYFFDSLH